MVFRSTFTCLQLCIVFSSFRTGNAECNIGDHGRIIDCRNSGLSQIPDIDNSANVTSLYLYGNKLAYLGPGAFVNFTNLVNLNLSTTGIERMDEFTFEGLENLRILDLTNNPVLGDQYPKLPDRLFEHCSQITHLHISGEPLKGHLFSPLEKLQEITMSPGMDYMPYELIKLQQLRVLNFAFCQMGENLTKDIMEPFSKGRLEEMAFHHCEFHIIENNTFDHFKHLRLLNLAGNTPLRVNDILTTISTSKELYVEDLIIDLAGSDYGMASVMLGPDRHGNCLPKLKYLKNLSSRGIDLLGFHKKFTICYAGLEAISVGFNVPYIFDGVKEGHYDLKSSMKYMDMSHLMLHDRRALKNLMGFWKDQSWIPPNKSYFPPRVAKWETINCTKTNSTELRANVGSEHQCRHRVDLPHCVVSIKVDHLANIGYINHNTCIAFSNNDFRSLNFSYHMHDHDIDMSDMKIYGLDKLEILDLSGFGLRKYNMDLLLLMPSIEELYIRENTLGTEPLRKFPELSNLKIIDLSENGISVLPNDMFENVTKLQNLYLRKNSIAHLNFLEIPLKFIRYVDLSGNKILSLSGAFLEHMATFLNLTLDLSDNPFQCDCHNLRMINWVQTTRINLVNRHKLRCHGSLTNTSMTMINLSEMRYHCNFDKILMVSLVFGITMFLMTAFLVVYRHRWTIRWHYYKTIYLRTHARDPESLLHELQNDAAFSTFIIYPIDDDNIRQWVVENMRKRIEQDWDKRECFLRGRDDIPGQWDYDNIVEGILKSKTALWIICPSFYEDKWCQSASNFALMHLGAENNAFLVMEDRFEKYSQPKSLKALLTQKHGVPVLRYTDDDAGRNMFWSQLEQFMHI